jgi:hypothetical protein
MNRTNKVLLLAGLAACGETQIAAKKALGGGKERFMALAIGNLESSRDLQVAHAELVHVRVIGSAFYRDGLLGALHTRMQHVLPTLLGKPPSTSSA